MQTRPSLRRSRRVAACDQRRVVDRVRQHGTRSNRHGRTSSSFPRSTTSRTSAREIIQSVVNSTPGGPPQERASTAVEEGPVEDDVAPVSFSTPAPITAARLTRLTNTSITSQLYGDESDTESKRSIAVGNNETSASAPRNRHDATQKTSASNGLNHNASSTSTTSQTAAPASTSTDATPGDASTTSTPSLTAAPNSIANVSTHGDPSLTSLPSQTAAPAPISGATTTSTNAGGMNDLPIDPDVMRAVDQAISRQATPQVSNGEDRATLTHLIWEVQYLEVIVMVLLVVLVISLQEGSTIQLCLGVLTVMNLVLKSPVILRTVCQFQGLWLEGKLKRLSFPTQSPNTPATPKQSVGE